MSADGTIELGGFERRLLTELRAVVADHAAAQPVSLHAARRAPRWSLAAALAGLAAACAVVLIALSAGSSPTLAQAFPILARPTSAVPPELAGFLRGNGASAQGATLDLRHARPFDTPLGTGYVLTDVKTNLICVAAPGFDRSWGASCGGARSATRQGVGGESYGPQGVSFVDVLPKGATATVRRAGGPARPAELRDGVLAFVTDRATTVTTRIDGHVITLRIAVPTRPPRVAVPAPEQVAAPVRLHLDRAGPVPTITASFHARYPSRRGLSTYVLETIPLKPGGRCGAGDSLLDSTSGKVSAGELVRLRGGAPNCAGRWRVTVSYEASTGALRYPGQWPEGIGNVTVAPRGSGAQIVSTQVITVGPRTAAAGRGRRTSRSGGSAGPRASAP